MSLQDLSLRQRKLLHLMQNQITYITGTDLSKELHVSPRTIRNDVAEINAYLADIGISITSQKSKGYILEEQASNLLDSFNETHESLLTKEDRVRFIALKLCLSTEPIDVYDLADEMFISSSTLDHCIKALQKKYVTSYPNIVFTQSKGKIYFERNEFKIRYILNDLIVSDWNYYRRDNAFYDYSYVTQELVDYCSDTILNLVNKYNIVLEDPCLISLYLLVAIMRQRVSDNHLLPPLDHISWDDQLVSDFTTELFTELNEHFSIAYPQPEMDAVYEFVLVSMLPVNTSYNEDSLDEHFAPETVKTAHNYLDLIKNVYDLDFTQDLDFYNSLLLLIQKLQSRYPILNTQGNSTRQKKTYILEFEIANRIQPIVYAILGIRLNEDQLLYLTFLVAGAMDYYSKNNPDYKIKTAIFSSFNLSAGWKIKRTLTSKFENVLKVVAVLPINQKNNFDFSTIDFLVTTINRPLDPTGVVPSFYLSNSLQDEEMRLLGAIIRKKQLDRLYPLTKNEFITLMNDSIWQEHQSLTSVNSIIRHLSGELIEAGVITDVQANGIMLDENISSYALEPGVVFLHTFSPADETKLAVVTLEHRVVWNSQKIRTVIMGAFKKEDSLLLLRLIHLFNDNDGNQHLLNSLKTKSEIVEYFSSKL